jgi:hypothetical protein
LRGAFADRLESLFGVTGSLVLSGLSFSVQRAAHGFLRGVVGVSLAGTAALMLGRLLRVSRGLLAPFLAHGVADATIATIQLTLAR